MTKIASRGFRTSLLILAMACGAFDGGGVTLADLDERTTSITPVLGLVGAFTTQVMLCLAVGHEEDDPATRVNASYMCPEFGEGPASNQVNVFECDVAWPGSIFRDRNRWVLGNDQPLIQRAFGIHRKLGNQHYGYFGIA